jgi:hypothetical protein
MSGRRSATTIYPAACRVVGYLADYRLSVGAISIYLTGLTISPDPTAEAHCHPDSGHGEEEHWLRQLEVAGLIEMLPDDPERPRLYRFRYLTGREVEA